MGKKTKELLSFVDMDKVEVSLAARFLFVTTRWKKGKT
jgi:hypothetical protein